MACASAVRSMQLQTAAAPARPAAARPAAAARMAVRAAPFRATQQPRRSLACRAAATEQEARWEGQVRDGRVHNVTPAEAGALLKDGWTLLDVRPPEEVAVSSVQGAVNVPLFVMDPDRSLGGLIKQATAFGMGGWWLGGGHMIPNQGFMAEVQAKIPRDAKVIVACQKGLRSLAAAEQLGRAGYGAIAWINGGLDTTQRGDLPVKGDADIRMAGIGGLSKVLGWTEAQQDQGNGGFAGGSSNVIKAFVVLLLLDGIWFSYEFLTNSPLSPFNK